MKEFTYHSSLISGQNLSGQLYDEEADVLYLSFECNDQVTGVELMDNVFLRLDTGSASGSLPRAIGFACTSYDRMRVCHQH
jgi:hypothetical protein